MKVFNYGSAIALAVLAFSCQVAPASAAVPDAGKNWIFDSQTPVKIFIPNPPKPSSDGKWELLSTKDRRYFVADSVINQSNSVIQENGTAWRVSSPVYDPEVVVQRSPGQLETDVANSVKDEIKNDTWLRTKVVQTDLYEDQTLRQPWRTYNQSAPQWRTVSRTQLQWTDPLTGDRINASDPAVGYGGWNVGSYANSSIANSGVNQFGRRVITNTSQSTRLLINRYVGGQLTPMKSASTGGKAMTTSGFSTINKAVTLQTYKEREIRGANAAIASTAIKQTHSSAGKDLADKMKVQLTVVAGEQIAIKADDSIKKLSDTSSDMEIAAVQKHVDELAQVAVQAQENAQKLEEESKKSSDESKKKLAKKALKDALDLADRWKKLDSNFKQHKSDHENHGNHH